MFLVLPSTYPLLLCFALSTPIFPSLITLSLHVSSPIIVFSSVSCFCPFPLLHYFPYRNRFYIFCAKLTPPSVTQEALILLHPLPHLFSFVSIMTPSQFPYVLVLYETRILSHRLHDTGISCQYIELELDSGKNNLEL